MILSGLCSICAYEYIYPVIWIYLPLHAIRLSTAGYFIGHQVCLGWKGREGGVVFPASQERRAQGHTQVSPQCQHTVTSCQVTC